MRPPLARGWVPVGGFLTGCGCARPVVLAADGDDVVVAQWLVEQVHGDAAGRTGSGRIPRRAGWLAMSLPTL